MRGRGGGLELCDRGSSGREVDVAEGLMAIGQVEALEDGGREGFRESGGFELVENVPDDAANPAGGEAAAAQGFIDGGDAADFEEAVEGGFVVVALGKDLKLRLDHLEAASGAGSLDAAIKGDELAGMELSFEIRAVEPDALDGVEALANGHFEDGHAAGAEQGGAADFANDADGFAGLERAKRARIEPVLIAEGQVEEEILNGGHAFFRQHVGDGRADALDVLHRSFEREHWSDAKAFAGRMAAGVRSAAGTRCFDGGPPQRSAGGWVYTQRL